MCRDKNGFTLTLELARVIEGWWADGFEVAFATFTHRVEGRLDRGAGAVPDEKVHELCRQSKKNWKALLEALRRRYARCDDHLDVDRSPRNCTGCAEMKQYPKDLSYVAVWESTKRGAPHIHVVMKIHRKAAGGWFVTGGQNKGTEGWLNDTWYRITGDSFKVTITVLEDHGRWAMASYMAGYFGKKKHPDNFPDKFRKYTTSRDVSLYVTRARPRDEDDDTVFMGWEVGGPMLPDSMWLEVPKERGPEMFKAMEWLWSRKEGGDSLLWEWMSESGEFTRWFGAPTKGTQIKPPPEGYIGEIAALFKQRYEWHALAVQGPMPPVPGTLDVWGAVEPEYETLRKVWMDRDRRKWGKLIGKRLGPLSVGGVVGA